MARNVRNKLLGLLTDADFDALQPHLKLMNLSDMQQLSYAGEIIDEVHFVETGVCSLQASVSSADFIEVGLIGSEGVTDHVMEKGDRSALSAFVQVPGSAWTIEAGAYANWIRGRYDALRLMVRYQQAFITQVSYTALSHGSFNLEERLARLLLMLFDRFDDQPLPFVHDRLAHLLSVRRSGVTTAMHVLEGIGAVRATRGLIALRDRHKLVSYTAGSYGTAEAEYDRLLGLHSATQRASE